MTLGDLRKFVEETKHMPDDIDLVRSGTDHSYKDVLSLTKTTALLIEDELSEDHFGDLDENEIRVPVIVLE